MANDLSELNEKVSRDEPTENQQHVSSPCWFPVTAELSWTRTAGEKKFRDKRTTMKEAVAGHIRNGIRLGFGGADSTRIPVAVVHEIIPRENIRNYPNLTAIPHILVDEVVEQPFAATPGDSYGHYGPDKSHLAGFEKICLDFVKTGKKDRLQEYYDRNIFGCEAFEDFLNLQPSATLQEIIKKGNQPIILT